MGVVPAKKIANALVLLRRDKKLLLLLALLAAVPAIAYAVYAAATFMTVHIEVAKGEVYVQPLKFEHVGLVGGDIDAQITSGKLEYAGDLGLNYTIWLDSDIPDDSIIIGFCPLLVTLRSLELPRNIVEFLKELGAIPSTEPYWFGIIVYAPAKWRSLIEEKLPQVVEKVLELLYMQYPDLAQMVYIEDNSLVIMPAEGVEYRIPLDVEKLPKCVREDSDDLCIILTPMPYPFYLPGGKYNVIGVNHIVADYVQEDTAVDLVFTIEGNPPITPPTSS